MNNGDDVMVNLRYGVLGTTVLRGVSVEVVVAFEKAHKI